MSSKGKSSAETGGGSAIVPKLRFPEFHACGAWERAPGRELFQQVNNREAPTGLPILAITQEHGAIPRHMIDYHVSVTDKSLEAYKEVRPGDFIISLRSFQGGIEFSEYHGICSPAYVILRQRVRLSDAFYRQHFKSHDFIQQLTRNLEGLRDGKMISYKQFSELQLLKPPLDEQQKIADCLASIDALVAAQRQKVEALRAHKKGLLQQLFPQEGETQPRLRFPEFEGTGLWEEKPFSAIVELISGVHLSPDEYSDSGEIPYFSGPSDFTDRASDAKRWTSSTKSSARSGDTLITVKGSGVGEVWLSKLPAVALGRQLMAARPKKDQISQYIFQFLLTKKRRFEILGAGNLIPGISRPDILDLRSFFPKPAEQIRIADCLTSVDDLIAAETRKFEMLKTHKKGLMQQLFPPTRGHNA